MERIGMTAYPAISQVQRTCASVPVLASVTVLSVWWSRVESSVMWASVTQVFQNCELARVFRTCHVTPRAELPKPKNPLFSNSLFTLVLGQ